MILTILIWIVLLALAVVSYILLARWKKKRWMFGLVFLWAGLAVALPSKIAIEGSLLAYLGYGLGSLLFCFAAVAFLIVGVVELVLFLRKRKQAVREEGEKGSTPNCWWKILIVVLLSVLLTVFSILLPFFTSRERYAIWQGSYNTVASQMFALYDEGKINPGDEYDVDHPGLFDDISDIVSDSFKWDAGFLGAQTGVCEIVLADPDTVLFSFGASLQSVEGIAITRNGKTHGDEIPQSESDPYYEPFGENVYTYWYGL